MQSLSERRWYYRYLNALDAREVLDHYGAENITEMPGGEGTTELVHSCLLDRVDPHHKNGDAHPSASVNVEKRKFICYASKWRGDLFHLVMKMEGKESFSDALLAVSDLIHAGPDDEQGFRAKLTRTMSKPGMYAIAPPDYGLSILNPWRQWSMPHPYLSSRGITEEAVELLQLGWDDQDNRIVFPHFFEGKLVGFQKRAIPAGPTWPPTAEPEPKYRSSLGFPKAETLYGYDRARNAKLGNVIVVESPFSVAKAHSLGLPLPVVATFGAKVTDNQLALLNNFDLVRVWFDDDPAGRSGERHIVENLGMNKVLVVEPDPGMDLADYDTKEHVQAKLAQAVPAFMKRAQYDTVGLRRSMK
jgi:DNA primase